MLWNRQAAATHRCAFLIDESDPMNRSPAPRSQPAIPGRRREVSERERADAAAQTAVADLPPAQTPTDAAPEMSVSDSAVAPESAGAGPAESSGAGASASATGAGVTKTGLDAVAATGGPATAAAAAGDSRAWMVGGALGVLGLGAAAAGGGGGGKDSSPTPPSGQTPDVPKPDVPKPDVPKPDVPKPDVPKPDVPKPDVPKPDVPKPDVPKPDVPKPDVPKPDEAKPKPDETKPDPQHPDDTKPDDHKPTDPTTPDDHKPVDPTPPDEHKPTDPQQPDGPTPDQPTPVEPPPPPARVQLALVNDTGFSDTDRLTHDATVRVDGIAAGNSWKYSVDGGTTWVEGGADHLVPAASFLADGEQHLRVVQSNASGESSEAAELVFELDRTAPVGVPEIALVRDTLTAWAPKGDRISSKGDLAVAGLDGVSAWVYSIDGGDWQRGDANHLIPEAAFGPDGHHTVQVKQVDEAGNEGAITDYDFTLDRFVAIPTLTFINSAVDADGRTVTNGGRVLLNGMETGGYLVEWLNQGTVAGSSHGWLDPRFETGVPLALELSDFERPSAGIKLHQGENTLDVCACDIANNWTKIERITFIYDTVAPDSPAVSLKHDDGASSTDKITSDATLTIAGLETSAKWKYSLDAGKTWTRGAGAELEASAITGAGEHTVRVIQTDLAGNDSAATVFTFTLDPAQSLIHPAPVI